MSSLDSSSFVTVRATGNQIELRNHYLYGSIPVYLTASEAIEIASQLVKLAMPEANKEEENNAFTA